ncbi:hypothetical protein BDV25DRAFT_140761 [Aspergillus avenaceus]|uniref:Uncharacterized protein n=1 Tax=Aspergillus avenaceus TaxID=36643 RepID=A0A5N6TT16_ASPAV|nr:hypothetical protein BDV25DRAFT_140761 [Aspergillus avenaceus]
MSANNKQERQKPLEDKMGISNTRASGKELYNLFRSIAKSLDKLVASTEENSLNRIYAVAMLADLRGWAHKYNVLAEERSRSRSFDEVMNDFPAYKALMVTYFKQWEIAATAGSWETRVVQIAVKQFHYPEKSYSTLPCDKHNPIVKEADRYFWNN